MNELINAGSGLEVQGAGHVLRFYASEEIVKKFSWDFCVHFHTTMLAALDEYEDYLNNETVQQLVSQVFYQSLQRFNTSEHLSEHCRDSRFMLNTVIDLPTDDEPEPRVKIVAELISLRVSQALASYDAGNLGSSTLH